MKFKIKKGDTVVMRRGKNGGKSGRVLHVDYARSRAAVEGLNLVKKHVRPRRQGEKGEQVSVPRTVAISSLALFCAKCGRGVRVGMRMEGSTRTRACKRCGSNL